MKESLSIRMDGKGLTSDEFLRAVSNFFKVAKNVAGELVAPGNRVEWIVEVHEGSNIVEGKPRAQKWVPDFNDFVITTILNGYSSIMNGENIRPPHFNDSALEGVRAVAGIKIDTIEVLSKDTVIPLTTKAVGTVDVILGSEHKSFGEVEGRLFVLSDQNVFKFSVFEQIHEREVTCYITKDELIDRAVKAFRRRVSVMGLVKYRRDGTPISVDADDIRVFDSDADLPEIDDVIGIYHRK